MNTGVGDEEVTLRAASLLLAFIGSELEVALRRRERERERGRERKREREYTS